MTKAVVTLLLLASAGLLTVITLGSWSQLQGNQFIQIAYILVYLGCASLVFRWNRGTLPVAAALATVLFVIAAVAAPSWFARDKVGIAAPALSNDLLALLVLLILPLQVMVVVFAIRAFNQEWNVEEGPGSDPSRRAR